MSMEPREEPTVINDTQLQDKLDQSPSDRRLTPELIKSRIAETFFHRATDVTTVCVLRMVNGFEVIGTSACADPVNYNQEIGERIAYDNAFSQLWPLEGYLLRESIVDDLTRVA